MFKTKKINNEVVVPIPTKAVDNRPIRGSDLFPEIYSNIFLCARKKSGKTLAVSKILKKCAGPDTQIVVFCSTINKDPTWEAIEEWAQNKGLSFLRYTSLFDDDGTNLLKELIAEMQHDDDEPDENENANFVSIFADEQPSEQPKRKSKFRSPEWIFILDDLADELRSPIIATFLKKNRHFKAKVIISSQYTNDLMPAAMKQLDYVLLFKGHDAVKLEQIRKSADLAIPQKDFLDMYQFATSQPYSFLYADVRGGTFRKNFNEMII